MFVYSSYTHVPCRERVQLRKNEVCPNLQQRLPPYLSIVTSHVCYPPPPPTYSIVNSRVPKVIERAQQTNNGCIRIYTSVYLPHIHTYIQQELLSTCTCVDSTTRSTAVHCTTAVVELLLWQAAKPVAKHPPGVLSWVGGPSLMLDPPWATNSQLSILLSGLCSV